MKVLCCLDGTNSEQISIAVKNMLPANQLTLGLIYVIDSGPHGELERQRERFLRPPALNPQRSQQMQNAETSTAQDILQEGARYLPGAERIQKTGRPEREIVNFAQEWKADLIVIFPRSPRSGGPTIGPKSVGHVARFVLDHAPCPVLLVRQTQ
ncbi:MAG TPA: universal stress protein [Ktedonobacteraceae bacterium]|nr:universal stress protein [Ktedonobacteraceae bacterium]